VNACAIALLLKAYQLYGNSFFSRNVVVRDGDDHLHDVSGLDLFGPADAGALRDDLHPNDAGDERIAERIVTIAFDAGGLLAPAAG